MLKSAGQNCRIVSNAGLLTTRPQEAADLPVGPYSEDTCWAQAVQVMPAALAVTRDVPVRVEAVQSQFRISFHPT